VSTFLRLAHPKGADGYNRNQILRRSWYAKFAGSQITLRH